MQVGKTLLTTALIRSSASRLARKGEAGKRIFYLKPVSTGPEEDSDVGWVRVFSSSAANPQAL